MDFGQSRFKVPTSRFFLIILKFVLLTSVLTLKKLTKKKINKKAYENLFTSRLQPTTLIQRREFRRYQNTPQRTKVPNQRTNRSLMKYKLLHKPRSESPKNY